MDDLQVVAIGDLPGATELQDTDLFVVEQSGSPVKVTAAQFAEYALGAANVALEAVLNGEVTT